VLTTVERALRDLRPGLPAELLLADSSQAHLHRMACTHRDEGLPGCPVPTPGDCPAVNRGQTLEFATGTTFDACPHLRDRDGAAVSAICVPVSINGTAAGVLHATGPDGEVLDVTARSALELLAARSGERIGVLRAFSRTESQAATDALTGLDNRRSFENKVADLLARGVPLSLAFGDLDHFKLLNDTYGHDAGDRALRAFARTLRQSLRPSDHAARWGGEEFVVVFPETTRDQASLVLDRVRGELARVVAAGGIPAFTVSFGVSDGFDGDDLETLVAAADRALLQAKDAGRDRVVVSGAVC
jgi:diguanylate cyclase (GGDEF)-like protein